MKVAEVLSTSSDDKTSKFGSLLLASLKASSLNEAIPFLNALVALDPSFYSLLTPEHFDFPFVAFQSKFRNSEFATKVCFNDKKTVFVHKDLMIGVYCYKDNPRRIPPYLLAYHTKTEQLVWGIPLTRTEMVTRSSEHDNIYKLCQLGGHIVVQFYGDGNITIIDAETGKINSIPIVPTTSVDTKNELEFYINPNGDTYQQVDGQIRLGKISDGAWQPTIVVNMPLPVNIQAAALRLLTPPHFIPLVTHCGISDDFESYLWIMGPTGDIVALGSCLDVYTKNGILFTIEPDPANVDGTLLKTRILKEDNTVVSGIEMVIPLETDFASFGGLCNDGQMVLYSTMDRDCRPMFVDLSNGEVVFSEHNMYQGDPRDDGTIKTYAIVNEETGELLYLDGEDEITTWKESLTTSRPLTTSRKNMGIFFFKGYCHHIDDKYLYFWSENNYF